MNPLRFRGLISTAAALAIVAVAMSWSVHAQAPQAGTAPPPPMGQMMHDHNQAMPDPQHMHGPAPQTAEPGTSEHVADSRELVSLPVPMQQHMLASMRDHLVTLNVVIGDIADVKFDAASKLLEERLGMSSLPLHHAAEMAPYFPQPMQDAGTSMHHAASRLVIALQNASVVQTFDSMREVNAALHEVTSACVGCHTAYRLR